MSLENLIQGEKDFFSDIADWKKQVSDEDIIRFRKETVLDRRMRISADVFENFNGTIQYGPFAGLKLPAHQYWGLCDIGSKIFGMYETQVLEQLVNFGSRNLSCFVQLGAADGYYVTGMLYSRRAKKAIAFEADPRGQAKIHESWLLNGKPGSLEICGLATEESIIGIDSRVLNGAVILIDVEGTEFELLTSSVIHHLRNSYLLIEVHHWIEEFEEKYELLLGRLFRHFEIKILPAIAKDPGVFRELQSMTDDNRYLLLSEGRPSTQRFLYLKPRIFAE